jgi:hypothetical protein
VINPNSLDLEKNILARSILSILFSYKMKNALPLVQNLLKLSSEQITLPNIETEILNAGLNLTTFREQYTHFFNNLNKRE